jgi:sugar/nucleoside kinase (ribokinase family)
MLPEVATIGAHRVQKLGIPVVADMGSGVREGQRDLMAAVDHAVFDERSIRRLAPDGGPRKACEAAQRMGPQHVAITRGERGVVSLNGDTYRELDAFQVDVVDTTGAGDVFHGAFCYGLLAGYEVETNLLFSSAVAAIKCTRLGGRAGIPRMPEVRRFLKERDIALPPPA